MRLPYSPNDESQIVTNSVISVGHFYVREKDIWHKVEPS